MKQSYRGFLKVVMGIVSVFYVTTLWSTTKNDALQINVDVAQFRDGSRQPYIEIYYSISRSSINYIMKADSSYSCNLVLDLEIYRGDSLWTNKLWRIEQSVKDTTKFDLGSELVDVMRYFVNDTEQYLVSLRVRDMNEASKFDSVSTSFDSRLFSDDKLELSDLELSTKIEKARGEAKKELVKNSYKVLPSPSRVFGQNTKTIFYYFEAYNLLSNIDGGKFLTKISVKDGLGRQVESLNISRSRRKKYDTHVDVGVLNVAKLASGKYSFVYGIADASGAILTERLKDFFIFNPNITEPLTVAADQSLGPLANLTEEELDEEFESASYITSAEEKRIYEGMDNAAAKRKYLRTVWNRPRQDDQITGWPFREEYLARVRFAEENYRSVFAPGARSDRGRVFILYGPPSNIERNPSTGDLLPHQIWTYEQLRNQTNVIFVFGDKSSLSKFELIHSTLRGELQDYSWQRAIARGSNENIFR